MIVIHFDELKKAWCFARMLADFVDLQIPRFGTGIRAQLALERFVFRVNAADVRLHLVLVEELFLTKAARVIFDLLMNSADVVAESFWNVLKMNLNKIPL